MESVKAIRKCLIDKGCPAEQVEEVCIDMSQAFTSGVLQEFPEASITFDRFHIVKLLNEAMDRVRKAERRARSAERAQVHISQIRSQAFGQKVPGA